MTSVEARPPAFSAESRINQEGPSCVALLVSRRFGCIGETGGEAYNLVEALGSTETSRASTDNKDVDVTAEGC